MKVFAATLLATAALGVHLQASSLTNELEPKLKKDVLAAVNGLIKNLDIDSDGHIYSNEVRQALLARGADKQMAAGISRGLSNYTEGDGISAEDLRKVMLN